METRQDEAQKSFDLALRMAKAEIRVHRLQINGAPPVIMNDAKKTLKKVQLLMAEDPMAQRLFPRAKRYIKMRDAREESWEKMFGGQLKRALEGLCHFYEGDMMLSGIDDPFEDQEDNEAWQKIRSVLDNLKERHVIADSFLELVRSVWVSYLYADIPPQPRM